MSSTIIENVSLAEYRYIASLLGLGDLTAAAPEIPEPFDAEKVMNEFNGRCKTRDGRDVQILTTEALGEFSILGNIHSDEDYESWTSEGKYIVDGDSDSDLVMPAVEPKVLQEQFINVYPDYFGGAVQDRESAESMRGAKRLGVLKLSLRDDKILDVEFEQTDD